MTDPRRTMDAPVQLLEPATRTAPEPFPGCDVCDALNKQWAQASDPNNPAHDASHALDLAVEIKRHPHAKLRGRK